MRPKSWGSYIPPEAIKYWYKDGLIFRKVFFPIKANFDPQETAIMKTRLQVLLLIERVQCCWASHKSPRKSHITLTQPKISKCRGDNTVDKWISDTKKCLNWNQNWWAQAHLSLASPAPPLRNWLNYQTENGDATFYLPNKQSFEIPISFSSWPCWHQYENLSICNTLTI